MEDRLQLAWERVQGGSRSGQAILCSARSSPSALSITAWRPAPLPSPPLHPPFPPPHLRQQLRRRQHLPGLQVRRQRVQRSKLQHLARLGIHVVVQGVKAAGRGLPERARHRGGVLLAEGAQHELLEGVPPEKEVLWGGSPQ